MFVYELSGRGFETRCCHLNDLFFTDETHASVRSSQRVLKIFAKFTGKYLCQKSIFFNEVSGLRAFNFFKKRPQHRCFPVNVAKFLKKAFFIEHIGWLLLTLAASLKIALPVWKIGTITRWDTKKQWRIKTSWN